MTRKQVFLFRAIALPVAYALLTAILPFIGNYDNPERFFRLWFESAVSLMLVVFLVVYVMALRSALAGDPSREATITGSSDDGSHRIGANGLPLSNGTDPYGTPGGISMTTGEVKIGDD